LGMGKNLRLQFKLSSPTAAAHVEISSGDMYVVDGESIRQFDSGVASTAVWRSRVYVFDTLPSLAWARVEAEGAATVRVYADGSLLYTKTAVADNKAFRLPPKKAREWYVEVEGASRVVSVVLASSTQELGV